MRETAIAEVVWGIKKKRDEVPDFIMAVGGAALMGVLVYLSYYLVDNGYSGQTGWAKGTGFGLVIALVISSAALIRALRSIIATRSPNGWTVITVVIAGLSLVVISGLSFLGLQYGSGGG